MSRDPHALGVGGVGLEAIAEPLVLLSHLATEGRMLIGHPVVAFEAAGVGTESGRG
jgi:hypothetical protein